MRGDSAIGRIGKRSVVFLRSGALASGARASGWSLSPGGAIALRQSFLFIPFLASDVGADGTVPRGAELHLAIRACRERANCQSPLASLSLTKLVS
jgi:hypothetical protein